MPTPQLPITTEVTPCHDDGLIPGSRRICVVMRMRVDKAGRDDGAGSVDDLGGANTDLADLGDPAVLDSDIGLAPRCSSAVDYGAVFYQQVTSHRHLSVFRCVVTIAIRNRTGERKERRNRQNWRRTG